MWKPLTDDDLAYICQHMMGIEGWTPMYSDSKNAAAPRFLNVLGQCQSKLEVMYFLGIAYYLSQNWGDPSYPHMRVEKHEDLWGIQIDEPFVGGRYGHGFSSLLVIPQYQSPDKPIHHDFGFFVSSDNGGGGWIFYAAVEIEGYGVHKERRTKDEARYRGLPYKVIQIFEETSNPLDWYRIFDPDVKTGVPGEYYEYDDADQSSSENDLWGEQEAPPATLEQACAQWIAFFDALSIPYERQETRQNHFRLPSQDCWFLVGLSEPDKEQQDAARLLAYQSDKTVYFFWHGCRLAKAGKWYKYPEPHFRYEEEEWSFEKCAANFYGPRIPFPFKDHILFKDRSIKEQAIIQEWNEQVALEGVEVPLDLVPLFELLAPYDYEVTLILEEYQADSCVSPKAGIIRLEPEEETRSFSPAEKRSLVVLATRLNQSAELKRFLAQKPGWRCFFHPRAGLEVGWSECPLCHTISLRDHICHCRSYVVHMEYDSPRLLAAYSSARLHCAGHDEDERIDPH